jgi:hypothetical protein
MSNRESESPMLSRETGAVGLYVLVIDEVLRG